TIDYRAPSARVQMTRTQAIEPGRTRPAPVEQRPDQYVSGTVAWNMALPAGAEPGTAAAAQPQPGAVEERLTEIWTTPHGFFKAAAANNALVHALIEKAPDSEDAGSVEVTFAIGRARYVGLISADNL